MIFCGTGDTAELLRESGGGLVVPPEDEKALAEALLELARNPSLRQQLGRSASNWYKKNINPEKACQIMREAINKAYERS